MVRSLTVDILSGFTSGYIIVALYDPSAPSVPVTYQAFSRPSQNPGKVIFEDVDDIVYEARIYQNSTNVPGGTLLRSYVFDEKYTDGTMRDDLELIAGVTPNFNVGSTSYVDPSLAGWKYSIEVPGGVGTLKKDSVYTVNNAGGFDMVDPENKFQDGMRMVLHFQAIIITTSPGSLRSGVLFSDTILIDSDRELDASVHFGKFIVLQGPNPMLNITLPAGASVPNGKMICLMSEGGSHIMAAIATSNSESFAFLNEARQTLYMGQSETLWLYFDGTNWRVPHSDGHFKTIGETIFHDALTELNTLQFAGQEISKTTYARLWEFVSTKYDASQLVDDVTWNFQDPTTLRYENHGKYADVDADNFRLPIKYAEKDIHGNVIGGTGFLRGVEGGTGNRKVGDFEADAVGNFAADIQGPVMRCHYSGDPTEEFVVLGTKPGGFGPIDGNYFVSDVLFKGKTKLSDGSFVENNETRTASTAIYLTVRY